MTSASVPIKHTQEGRGQVQQHQIQVTGSERAFLSEGPSEACEAKRALEAMHRIFAQAPAEKIEGIREVVQRVARNKEDAMVQVT